jgi:hypothetical protein
MPTDNVNSPEIANQIRSLVLNNGSVALPDSPEACYAYVRTQTCNLEMINSLGYWKMGEVTNYLGTEHKVEHPIQAMARETGAGDRMLRYCDATFRAFKQEDLQVLCRKGMKWSTVRELASEIMEPNRDQLVKLFLDDRITDLEVRNYVAKVKGGVPLSTMIDSSGARVDDDGSAPSTTRDGSALNKQFEKAKKSLLKHAQAFCADAEIFNTGLKGELSDVLFRVDGTDDPAVVEDLAESDNGSRGPGQGYSLDVR